MELMRSLIWPNIVRLSIVFENRNHHQVSYSADANFILQASVKSVVRGSTNLVIAMIIICPGPEVIKNHAELSCAWNFSCSKMLKCQHFNIYEQEK